MSADTGLRKGEALALGWDDINWTARTIAVRGTLTKRDGAWVVSEPKTTGSGRVLTPDASVVALLREHRKVQLEDPHTAAKGVAGLRARVHDRSRAPDGATQRAARPHDSL